MVPVVEIVDHQQVDAVHAETLQRILERAHQPIITVVELMIEMQAAGPEAGLEMVGIVRRLEHAPNLGRQHELAPGTVVEKAAGAMLALAAAIPRRRVEVADARRPGCLKRRLGVGLAHLDEQVAQRRATEP